MASGGIVPDKNKIDRINTILGSSAHHREQLNALAEEFCNLHAVKPGSDDEEDLVSVILDGDNYKRVLLEIRRRRAKKWRENKKNRE
jgi:hypothetical protein